MRRPLNPFPRELDRGLRHDPDRRSALKRVWDSLEDEAHPEVVPGDDEAWTEIAARLERANSSRLAADRPPQRRFRRRVLIAAVVALAAVASGLVWQVPATHEAPPGTQRVVRLSDGSTVHLNSASSLVHKRRFMNIPFVASSTRAVKLDGEAFFEVESDPERPFVVQTSNARIEVLGTRFNVRARSSERTVETIVTLAEGRIALSAEPSRPGTKDAAVLGSPGDSFVIRENGPPRRRTSHATLERTLAWRERGFAAVDESVGSILREVELRFAIHVSVAPGLETATPMTVFYQRGTSPEEIVHDICLARGWQYRPLSRGFAVFSAQEPSPSGPDINV